VPDEKKIEKPAQLAKVQLSGQDGNVYSMIGRCARAGQRAGYSQEQLAAFKAEALSGDYDHAIQTCLAWFDVE
jgi:hypothetical protein